MPILVDGRRVIELEEGWNILQQGITKLTSLIEGVPGQQFTSQEYAVLYSTAYDMGTQHSPHYYAAEVYDRYRESLEEYINSKVLPAIREKHAEFMLKELVKRWMDHKVMVRWLSRILSYLERFFVPRNDLPTLTKVGVMCFRDLVYAEMKVNVKDAVIALINREREGEQIDQALVKNVVGIFIEMGMGQMEAYEADFETFLLGDTRAFYKSKASSWIQEDSCPVYMTKAEDCLKQEKKRIGDYLHASSKQTLLQIVQQELLTKYQIQLLEKENLGCHTLLRDDKADDLRRMYRLFRKIPKGLVPVAAIFRQHITDDGIVLIKQADDAAKNKEAETKDTLGVQEHGLAFVREALDLHDKYFRYVSECFGDYSLFHKALKEGFEDFCNKRVAGSTSAELLALFCDNLLTKGGSKKLSDDETEETLEKVVELLAFINDKDLFTEFCRKMLARRLLFDKSANNDLERSILTKLKQQYGGQYTSKMEGMVNDLEVASENQSNFKKYLTNKDFNVGIDLSVTVLTSQKWPGYKTSDLALPIEMVKCVEVYNEFYRTITNQRKLTWIYSLGTCSIVGKFDDKPMELIVTIYQAVVLLLFNVEDRWSYSDIKNQVNVPDEDVVRLLHSLSCAKYKILNKDHNIKTVGKKDLFEFNTKFTDKMRRIKIQVLPVDEKQKVIEDVHKDRRYTIDASIVRIMKNRKQLSFQQLLVECVEQLRESFKPDVKFIKKRVEDLISCDFLERDSDNLNVLKYLA